MKKHRQFLSLDFFTCNSTLGRSRGNIPSQRHHVTPSGYDNKPSVETAEQGRHKAIPQQKVSYSPCCRPMRSILTRARFKKMSAPGRRASTNVTWTRKAKATLPQIILKTDTAESVIFLCRYFSVSIDLSFQ